MSKEKEDFLLYQCKMNYLTNLIRTKQISSGDVLLYQLMDSQKVKIKDEYYLAISLEELSKQSYKSQNRIKDQIKKLEKVRLLTIIYVIKVGNKQQQVETYNEVLSNGVRNLVKVKYRMEIEKYIFGYNP